MSYHYKQKSSAHKHLGYDDDDETWNLEKRWQKKNHAMNYLINIYHRLKEIMAEHVDQEVLHSELHELSFYVIQCFDRIDKTPVTQIKNKTDYKLKIKSIVKMCRHEVIEDLDGHNLTL